MQEYSGIDEVWQSRLAVLQEKLSGILKVSIALKEVSEIPPEKTNTLRYFSMQKVYQKLNTFLSFFGGKIYQTYIELQEIIHQIIQHKLSDPFLKELEGTIVNFKEMLIPSLMSLIEYKHILQKSFQLEDTLKEQMFLQDLHKQLISKYETATIGLSLNEQELLKISRIMTLYFTFLLHNISEESLPFFAEEVAYKFINYLLANETQLVHKKFSEIFNESCINAILKMKGSRGYISDGQQIKLISGDFVHSDDPFFQSSESWIPLQTEDPLSQFSEGWVLLQTEDLLKNYIEYHQCESDSFKGKILDDLYETDMMFSNLNAAIVLLKYEISCNIPLQPTINTIKIVDYPNYHKVIVQNKTRQLYQLQQMQKEINSQIAEITDICTAGKSKNCIQFMKLIKTFFSGAILLLNLEDISEEEKKVLTSGFTEFCQAYLDAGVVTLQYTLNSLRGGGLSQKQLIVQKFIIKMQSKLKKWQELGDTKNCIINLEKIELFLMNFSHLSFSQVSVTVDQLVKISSIKTIRHLDEEKRRSAVEQKFEIAKNNLAQAIVEIKLAVLNIDACEHLTAFSCSGEMPSIDQIPEQTLKFCVRLALNSQEINLDKVSFSHASQLDIDEYINRSLEDIKKELETILAHRNYDLGFDVTAWVSHRKLTNFYNNIQDTFLNISDNETLALSDLDSEQAIEITELLDQLKQLRQQHREAKQKVNDSDQRCVNSLIANLYRVSPHDDPDESTPEYRLRRAEEIVCSNPEVVLDLRNYQLKTELVQNLNAASPQLILSSEQFDSLLTEDQQRSRHKAFLEVIKTGNIEEVKKWIKAKIDINLRFDGGRTYLMIACFNGQAEVAQLLLEEDADPSVVTEQNISILESICALDDITPGHIAVMNLLEKRGITLNFYCLIMKGDIIAVKEAIKSGEIDLNQSLRGETPLHYAVNFKHVEIVALLLKNGADRSIPNAFQKSPVEMAIEQGALEIAKLLLRMDSNIHRKDRFNRSLLYYAAKKGLQELSNLLIQYGAKIDLDTAILLNRYNDIKPWILKDNKLLYKVIELEQEEIAIWLIGQDNVKLCCEHLEMACEKGMLQTIDKLLQHFREEAFSMVQACKNFPLVCAVQKNNLELAELLLKYGANPNAINLGKTCLHEAVMNQLFDMAKLLIHYGADVLIKDKWGYLPLHRAAEKGNKAIIELLMKAYLELPTDTKKLPFDLLPKNSDAQLLNLLDPSYSISACFTEYSSPKPEVSTAASKLLKNETWGKFGNQQISVYALKFFDQRSLRSVGCISKEFNQLQKQEELEREEQLCNKKFH